MSTQRVLRIFWKRIPFVLLLVAPLAVQAATADVYIAQSAAGSADGSSCANAKAVSFFNTASNWGAGAGQIGPGKTVHLCGTITTPLTANGSGSSESPITILFETGAKISVPACGPNGCINIAAKSYITIDGSPTSAACGVVNGVDTPCNGTIEATGNGTSSGNGESLGIGARRVSNCEIRNLNIINMYIHSGSGNDVPPGNYYAIHFEGANNLFHNNVIHDAAAGIVAESTVKTSGNRIYNNQIYNINWGVFLSGPGSNSPDAITNNQIYSNNIHDFANWDTTSNSFHHDGIMVAGNNYLANGVSHIDIYNNYIHGTISNCADNCMTAYIFVNDANNVRTFNNLLVANSGESVNNALIFYWSPSALQTGSAIYNNTVIGGTASGTGGCISVKGDSNAAVENNIMSNCGVTMWFTPGTTFSKLDYNIYQDPNLAGTWRIGNNFYDTISGWRTASGGDANAQATTGSLNLDPSFKPQSGSMAVNAGANLTSLGIAALNSDKAGITRPPTGAWDIGAYQYTAVTPSPPSSPKNLRVR
jgi:hypothetical protein